MSGQQLASHWARSPPGGVAGIDGIPADRVCPSQRILTCRFIVHWTPTSHLISMIVDTCDSADRHSAAFRAVSVWHVQSDRPPSLKNHCGHGVCSNGWVKLFILGSGRVPAAYHPRFEVCVANHLQDCRVFLRCERLVYRISICRIVECCRELAVASYG